jgi:hypothetical protein
LILEQVGVCIHIHIPACGRLIYSSKNGNWDGRYQQLAIQSSRMAIGSNQHLAERR